MIEDEMWGGWVGGSGVAPLRLPPGWVGVGDLPIPRSTSGRRATWVEVENAKTQRQELAGKLLRTVICATVQYEVSRN